MVPGLLKAHYDYPLSVAHGDDPQAPANVKRHCELKGWVRAGRLTEDDRQVLTRAMQAPLPPKHWSQLLGGRRPGRVAQQLRENRSWATTRASADLQTAS
jgi:hypothetical protein